MNFSLGLKLKELLINSGLSEFYITIIIILIVVLSIIILGFIAYFITNKILFRIVIKLARKTKSNWVDIFDRQKVFKRLSHLAPAIVIYYFAEINLVDFPRIASSVQSIAYIYMIFAGMLVLDAFLDALHSAYMTLPVSRERPIKGYVQSVKIIIYAFGIIFILSVIIGKSPGTLFASLGAIAAILILVFKDTILGFVSGIQLSANKMVKPGDWISMPSRNADGTVLEITLNTVKIQNWDKTISTVPTYALISESFQNWKGMEESKGRRIKRSLYVDIKTVKFCDTEMLNRFKKIKLIQDYIEIKQKDIAKYNIEKGIENDKASRRNLTNIGIFRVYIEKYLEQHPNIYPNIPPYTTMVRHLDPTEKGIPIQIYAFSKIQDWVEYEKVQADIFDHILAVISEFELSIFQNPTGDDFRQLTN
ncbi:MAG: mechanosensitive ion channel family protein [Bacteroidales bacterium]|nr:mechanosensitive ion channel family protein [Bacteroidales bacterium]